MHRLPTFPWIRLGIESVAVAEEIPVARVDVMTRSPGHAADLEAAFGIRPFRYHRGKALLHAFSRLPAPAVRRWLAERNLDFSVTTNGLKSDGPLTWVQGGHAP